MTEKADNTTDKKPDSVTSGDQARSGPAAEKPFEAATAKKAATPPPLSGNPTSLGGSQNVPPMRTRSAVPAYGLLVLVIALAGAGLWYQNETITTLKSEVQSQLSGNANAIRQAQQQAEQAAVIAREQGAKLALLSSSYEQSKEQYQDLSQAFQALTDKGSDLILINDIDHLATIAQQQLMLGGNVGNAIIALESAQAQLARANRARLSSLQQTINGDLERLRAVTAVDVDGLSRQLDTLGSLLAQAPLLVPDDVAVGAQGEPITEGSTMAVPEQVGAEANWWERSLNTTKRWGVQAWRSLSHDLGQFVSIRRVDDTAALMMSPEQAANFRENMSLRVMTAQLAMMMNQAGLWQKELDALDERVSRRYDQSSPQVQQAMRLIRQLQETRIGTRLPTVDNTLAAIESLRQQAAESSPDIFDGLEGNTPPNTQADQPTANDEQDNPATEPEAGSQSALLRLIAG
ncbi:uroporphyrinogen-III C-methyltransferase [Alcaligenes endophyticus]|uniref:Uroporphyrinogen-III C-methyltransferase n=1 Tax=Alcaligenes endophyticus TaxID=1929088 RepID=A0ABT8EKR8_9BURK|nr:uroporphyrinogen-III C-methyltransferase [Alcaligenes endophyticus]MCX5590749.1 uroporphyrinogen-III C-methyltransferase [Alcaligenes endophyticus]MDN4121888.1 uroporphyrinogen-III C-methyltransferase [Alcaligenes endophyticus]